MRCCDCLVTEYYVVRFISLSILILSGLVGCGNVPQSRFVPGEQTVDLIPEARRGFPDGLRGVRSWVDEQFGTPNDLIAWRRLPVDFGGADAEVIAVEAPDVTAGFTVRIDGDFASTEDVSITWLTGDHAGDVVVGATFSADESRVSGEFADLPDVGDRLILNAGRQLQRGRMLYMEHCVHCHGTSGDGNGPTAEYLNPRPRDYRLGKFKFKSTAADEKPTRGDLDRIIRHGIPGTYMPSFMLLDDKELPAIIEYIRWLSMRGEFEQRLVNELLSEFSIDAVNKGTEGDSTREEVLDNLRTSLSEFTGERGTVERESNALTTAWLRAEGKVIFPKVPRVADTDGSRRIGRELYLKKGCVDCHGKAGKGNGLKTVGYEKLKNEFLPEAGLHDAWGNLVKPRDFTTGIYRGGRRPLDLYRRVRGGILASKMPPHPESALTDEQVWQVVNYVLSIPLEGN